MDFLTTTFSPAMLAEGTEARIMEIRNLEIIPADCVSAVGHEVTALVLSALLGRPVPFARVNLRLHDGDTVWSVIPNFRAILAREFTREEIEAAGWRAFRVDVLRDESTDPPCLSGGGCTGNPGALPECGLCPANPDTAPHPKIEEE